MTNGMRRSGRLGARFPRRAAMPIAVLLGVAVLFVVPTGAIAGAPTTVWGGSSASWTNGLVLCVFAPSAPSVGASALARPNTGMTLSVESMAEVSSGGSTVASADLANATWSVANLSSDDAYDLAYFANASVIGAGAAADGTVAMQVQFVLPAYAEEGAPAPNAVVVALNVSGWPWRAPTDHLILTFAAQPSFPTAEHLILGAAGGPLVAGASTSSGATFEQLFGAASANATPAGGGTVAVPATATVAGSSAAATVSVAFGDSAGAYSALSYAAQVTIVFPPSIAGIPTVDLVAVGAAAAVVSLVLAAGVRRIRRGPSNLTYVEEEP